MYFSFPKEQKNIVGWVLGLWDGERKEVAGLMSKRRFERALRSTDRT